MSKRSWDIASELGDHSASFSPERRSCEDGQGYSKKKFSKPSVKHSLWILKILVPLFGESSGYWKLRVDDYRVVYSIKKEKVLVKVIKIGARRDFEVYEELVKRIPKILD